jgi:hypothetical protein
MDAVLAERQETRVRLEGRQVRGTAVAYTLTGEIEANTNFRDGFLEESGIQAK